MADHVVATREGHPVEVGVDVVGVGHALGEGCASRDSVCDHVVADLSVCLCNDWLIRWRHQDLVDDVYDPVRSRNVCECDIGIVDLDSLSDCEG